MNLKSHESFSFLLRLRDRKNILKKKANDVPPSHWIKAICPGGSAGLGFACQKLGRQFGRWAGAYQREPGNAFGAESKEAP